jgi:hypothetical protein
MPNVCINGLSIEGPEADLSECLEAIREGDIPLSFQKVQPPPTDVDADLWRSNKWGTDREGWDFAVKRSPGRVDMGFATSWSPPEGVILHLSRRFFSLAFTLEWEQPEPPETGTLVCRNGVVVLRETT